MDCGRWNKRLDKPKAYPKRVKVKMPSFKKQFPGEDPVMNLGAQKVGVSKAPGDGGLKVLPLQVISAELTLVVVCCDVIYLSRGI